jgi:putative transposase
VFAGQRVGVKEIEEKIWLVSFMKYDLGFFDHETRRIECAENQPLPVCPEWTLI